MIIIQLIIHIMLIRIAETTNSHKKKQRRQVTKSWLVRFPSGAHVDGHDLEGRRALIIIIIIIITIMNYTE